MFVGAYMVLGEPNIGSFLDPMRKLYSIYNFLMHTRTDTLVLKIEVWALKYRLEFLTLTWEPMRFYHIA